MHIRSMLIASVAIPILTTTLSAVSPTHTWVSGTGSDSNPGTRAQPFLTFQAAVNATAAGGLVSVADPGDFGAVSIAKSITIDGGDVGGTITFTGSEGVYIDAGASDTVILRHLNVHGVGLGTDAVFLATGGYLVVEDCVLEGFTQIGLGVGSAWAQNISVKNTTINGGQLGVRVFQGLGPVSVTLRNMTITGASDAAIFTRSGTLDVSYSTLSQNSIALECDTSTNITAESNVISHNTTAIAAFATGKIRISNNEIVENTTGISLFGGTVMSAGNNKIGGNATPGAPNAAMNVY